MRSKAMALFGILGSILGSVPDLNTGDLNTEYLKNIRYQSKAETYEHKVQALRKSTGKHFVRHMLA